MSRNNMASTNKESATGDKLSGLEDTVTGRMKEEIGNLTGNPELSGVGAYEKNLGHQELNSANEKGHRLRQRKSSDLTQTESNQYSDQLDQGIDIPRATEYAGGAGTKVAGVIESVVGSMIGDQSLKDQGEGKKIEGELQMRNA